MKNYTTILISALALLVGGVCFASHHPAQGRSSLGNTSVATIRPATTCIDPDPQYESLKVLYDANSGWDKAYADTWFQNCDPCSGWHGIRCSGYDIVRLTIDDKAVTTIPVDAFKNLNELLYLDIKNTKVSTIPTGSLDTLQKLEHLDLTGNKLDTVSVHVFDKLSSLYFLDLNTNNIAAFDDDFSKNLRNLRILDLSKNPFTELPDNFLSNLKSLKTIILSETGLKQLSYNFFINQIGSVDYIDISYNASLDWTLPHYFCGTSIRIWWNDSLIKPGICPSPIPPLFP